MDQYICHIFENPSINIICDLTQMHRYSTNWYVLETCFQISIYSILQHISHISYSSILQSNKSDTWTHICTQYSYLAP